MVLLSAVFVAPTQAANHQGDLEIYKGGLPLDKIGASTTENTLPSGNAILLMLDMSDTEGQVNSGEFKARKEKTIKTIKYLMEDDGIDRLSEDTLVGVGVYPSSALPMKNLNNGMKTAHNTASIGVPVGRIGAVGSKQRYKILTYLNQLTNTSASSPMSSAYAEAGAYMMGTTTSQLANSDANSKILNEYPDTVILTRVLRQLNGVWEYCPPNNRQLNIYEQKNSDKKVFISKARIECPEILANGEAGWVDVNKANIASWNWATTKEGLVGSEEKNSDLSYSKVDRLLISGKSKYDLMWQYDAPWPVNTDQLRTKISPLGFNLRSYHFKQDSSFINRKVNRKENSKLNRLALNNNLLDDRSWGTPDGKTYYYDATLTKETVLAPVLKYRRYRTKGFLNHKVWQYCDYNKAELVHYIHASYRLMCDDANWITMTRDNNTDSTLNWSNTRPSGIDENYRYDAVPNPYDGWSYYTDERFSGGQFDLPLTVNTNFPNSGIRHSAAGVRRFQSYQYDQPNYRICRPNTDLLASQNQFTSLSINPYQSNPDNRAGSNIASASWAGDSRANANSAMVQSAAIFFITSGLSSAAASTPLNEMNKSLGLSPENSGDATEKQLLIQKGVLASSADPSYRYACNINNSGLTANPANSHWGCMGAYARRLNSVTNPTTRAIKTGVFLISSSNPVIDANSCHVEILTSSAESPSPSQSINHASQIASYKKACKLGSSDYGDGGFYSTNTDSNLPSIQAFAKAINERTQGLGGDDYQYGLLPSGSIEVPANSLRPGELMPYGFLPLVTPNLGSGKSQWSGNLRKYIASANGYIDKGGNSPFLNPTNRLMGGMSKDYWATSLGFSNQQTGGVFEKIKTPIKGNSRSARKVYVSNSMTKRSGQLQKINPLISSISTVKVFSEPTEPLSNKDILLQRLLLNYMGYPIRDYHPEQTTDTQILNSVLPEKPYRVMGAVVHSTPVSFVSKASVNPDNGHYTPDEQYILFGAMDNAVHVVKSSNGEEVFSYFPKEVLDHKGQFKGITAELTADKSAGDNAPSFGVDGPWAVYTSYSTTEDNGVEADKLFAFGGARLGAKAYYGLDLTGIHKGNAPRQLFSIVKSGVFKRLGYSWGKPVVTKIRWQGHPKLVVILTGGYDEVYDKTDAQRIDDTFHAEGVMTQKYITKTYKDEKTQGNAIYIVDAKTGAPLIVSSNVGADINDIAAKNSDGEFVTRSGESSIIPILNSHMKYSIPGNVTVLDRDADDLTDHVYFADLNGQIFRMDIDNKSASLPTKKTNRVKKTNGVGLNPKVRVQRIANLNGKQDSPGPRFYEAPTITIQTNHQGNKFATVSMASGDRSNPLSDNLNTQAVYTIYDKDVAKQGLFNADFRLAPVITAREPVETLGVQSLQSETLPYNHNGLIAEASPYSNAYQNYDGWMVPLTHYGASSSSTNGLIGTASTEGTKVMNNIKAMGPLSAIGNKLYVSAYNPDNGQENTQDACLPEVLGTTEIHQYCLPYGVCSNSINGNGHTQYQRFKAGSGIIIPSFGTDFKDDKVAPKSRRLINQNDDANIFITLNNSGPQIKSSFIFKGSLRPLMWFDLQSKKQ